MRGRRYVEKVYIYPTPQFLAHFLFPFFLGVPANQAVGFIRKLAVKDQCLHIFYQQWEGADDLFCKFFSDSDQNIQEQITFLRYVLLVYMKFMNFLSSHVLIVNFDLLVFSVKKHESKNLAKGIHLALTDDGLPKS